MTMIVKRVADALRRQDWVTVAIEFLLVVLGVLLAFQINEWSTEREAKHERAAATDRLLSEAEQNVAYIRLGVTIQKRLVGDVNYALSQVQNGRWQSADKERMTKGLQGIKRAPPMAPPSAVYDDLIASGIFGNIGDARLRSAIARYRATLNFHNAVVGDMRVAMPALEDHAALRYRFNPVGSRWVQLDVDFAALRADHLLQEKLAILADGQRVQLVVSQRALKDASRMCVELGRFVGRACNLNLPPPTFG